MNSGRLFWILSVFILLAQTQKSVEKVFSHSFDFGTKEYPHMIQHTYGATVIQKNFVKLVPPVPFRAGELATGIKNFVDEFRADVTFEIKSTPQNQPYGFAMWYLNAVKPVNDRKGNLFGIKGDYSGLGIFLYKSVDGNWLLHGHFNRGMDEYRITNDKVNEDNACSILGGVENAVRTIRYDFYDL